MYALELRCQLEDVTKEEMRHVYHTLGQETIRAQFKAQSKS